MKTKLKICDYCGKYFIPKKSKGVVKCPNCFSRKVHSLIGISREKQLAIIQKLGLS